MFCAIHDVRLALAPVLTPDNNPGDTPAKMEDFQIVDAIREAEGTVMTYIGSRYVVNEETVNEQVEYDNELTTKTFDVAPQPVRSWTRNIAAWLLSLTHRRSKDISEDDPIRLRYNATMDMLKEVQKRTIDLGLPGVPVGVDDNAVAIFNQYEGTLFGLEDTGLSYEGGRDRQRLIAYRDW